MKKCVLRLFMLLCLLFTLSLITQEIPVKYAKASQTIWIVGADGLANFTKIQEAINNESVIPGDTIFVRAGTYYEKIVVNKTLSIIGEGMTSTIIDGEKNGTVVSIEADNVFFSNFTVRKSGTEIQDIGIRINYCNGVVLRQNKIIDNNIGIGLSFSSNNMILNSEISSNSLFGVSLSYCSGNTISDNVISKNDGGVYLHLCSGNIISGNFIFDNYHGVYLSYGGNNTIYHNNFNNTKQVVSDTKNFWTYNGEGNYWNDYVGHDVNQDGIGDNSYYIDVNNQDDCPLMGMFWGFNVVFRKETYYVPVISNSTLYGIVFELGEETGNKIIRFNTTLNDNAVGFCRIMIPTGLMDSPPYIVLINSEEVVPTLLNVSNEMFNYLYFNYVHNNSTITIISSKTLQLYKELFEQAIILQMDLDFLNLSYQALLNEYLTLLGNYSLLKESYDKLNVSYQEHLLHYYEQMQNVLHLRYLFTAAMGIFIVAIVYLSKNMHAKITSKAQAIKDE